MGMESTDKIYIKKTKKAIFSTDWGYGKFGEGNSGNEDSYNMTYVGKGASASLSILAYL